MSEKQKAILYLILAATLFSTAGLMVKWIDWNPVAITGTRGAIAASFLWIFLRRPQFTWSKSQIGGGVAYAVTVFSFIAATKLTTASNAILLQYTAPIYVAFLGIWFLKEKVSRLDWITVFFILGGMVLFFFDKLSLQGVWGNILAILSSISLAWMILFLRKQKNQSSLESILLGSLLAALISIPFLFDNGPDFRGWMALLFLGVVQQGIALIFYVKALNHLRALEVILISTVEPILNPIWVFLLIGEVPGVWGIVGGIIVLISITFRGVVTIQRS